MTYHLMLFPDFKEKAVTLSYDDGLRADIRLIEIMQKYGLKGTFNIDSGRLAEEKCVHANEVRQVYVDSGNEVAVHGVKHVRLTCLTDEQIVQEIYGDRRALEDLTGKMVTGMAYAYGSFDDRVVKVLKTCGIDYARTVLYDTSFRIWDDWLRLRSTCHNTDPQFLALADAFMGAKYTPNMWVNEPKVFFLWGHSTEFEARKEWHLIEEFGKKVGNRTDVWYATNGEIFRYVEAYKALRYSVDGRTVYNPTAITVYGKTLEGKNVVYPAGEYTRI